MVCLQTQKAPVDAPQPVIEKTATSGSVQRCLLLAYRLGARLGLFSTRFGRAIFAVAYDLYKSRWEASEVAALKNFVRSGTTVIDVGANIGFFTRRFAEWVRPGGLIIAIEPEAQNFANLKAMLSRRGLVNVEPVQAVAAERSGTLKLAINPLHPADHRIAATGLDVTALTLDDMLRQRGMPVVSLVKIDVQGAEERVLRGSLETLRRCKPAVFMEIDESALSAMGSSSHAVLLLMGAEGYRVCRIAGGKLTPPLPVEHVSSICRVGAYANFIFVPKT
jgi:FkbM family methyltransferase